MASIIAATGTYIVESMADFGLHVGKEHFADRLDEQRLHDSLKSFIEKHRKYNDMCSLSEEIDFQGLVEYIDKQFLNDVSTRVFSARKSDRKQARESLINRAVAYSNATTKESQLRVAKLVGMALDIIKDFYAKKTNKKEWIVASAIVDAVTEEVKHSENEVKGQIVNTEERLVKKIDSLQQSIDSQFGIEAFLNLSKQGNFSGIEDRLHLIATAISEGHPLYPDYGFDLQMESVALSADATLKYPPKFVCRGIVKMGEEVLQEINPEVISYADRHQLQITLDIIEAKKLLGEIEDPSQTEAERLVGQRITRPPEKFGPAIPCNIRMNDEVIYEYVELRTEEILDDGTYVVSNKEQKNCCFRVVMKFKLENRKGTISYSMSIEKNAKNKDYLRFIKMAKEASEGGNLVVYALNLGRELMAGYTDPFEFKSGFDSVDEEIDFMSRVCDIEDYAHRGIQLPEQITEREFSQILYVSEIIRGGENEFSWSSQTFTGTVDQNFRNKIAEMDDSCHELAFVGMSKTNLFGTDVEVPIVRRFRSAKIKDLDRFKKKLEYTDDGESISISYIAGEDNVIVDSIKPEDIQLDLDQ